MASCNGIPSLVRPGWALHLCRGCAEFAGLGPHRGPAKHNGTEWVCTKFRPVDQAPQQASDAGNVENMT